MALGVADRVWTIGDLLDVYGYHFELAAVDARQKSMVRPSILASLRFESCLPSQPPRR